MYRAHFPEAPGMHKPLLHHCKNTNSNARKHTDRHLKFTTFAERLGLNFTSTCFGFILFVAAITLLSWNERRVVTLSSAVEEGLGLVVPLSTSQVAFDEHNNKLVHVMGTLTTNKLLEDLDYDVQVEAVKLRREVEMYQWEEIRRTKQIYDAGEARTQTVYSYNKRWQPELIESEDFEENELHRNPITMVAVSKEYTAEKVFLGTFRLSEGLITKISKYKLYTLYDIPASAGNAQLYNGYIYHGSDPKTPQIGDVRIRFTYAGVSGKQFTHKFSDLGQPEQVSVLAKQVGATLTGYETYSGEIIEMLMYGRLSAEEIFAKAENANSMMAWSLRLVGFLMLITSVILMHHVITVIVSWIPLIKELEKLIPPAFVIGLSYSVTASLIGMMWVIQRPLLTVFLLITSLIPLFIALRKRGHQRAPTKV
ncbi:transmembrane protein 43-like [Glandiceps talaboti]